MMNGAEGDMQAKGSLLRQARVGLNSILYGRYIAPYVQLLPAAAVLLFMFILPLGSLFVISLWHYSGSALVPTALTLENYTKFFIDAHYRLIALRSLQLAFTTAAVSLIIGYPLAYIFARVQLPGKNIFLFLLLTPLFVSVVVRSFGWVVLLERGGVLNWALQSLGIIDKPLTLLGTTTGVVIGLVNVELTFMVLPIYSSLTGIPRSYEEAAQTLGANPIVTWWKITLPLSLPGVIAGWLLVFATSVSAYVQPSLLGGASFFVMSTELYSQLNNVLNWPFAAAIGYLLLVIALACSLLPALLSRWLLKTGTEGVN